MKQRKMAMVVKHVDMNEEDASDVAYWLNKTVSERIGEVTRLRLAYYQWLLGDYPQHIEKSVTKRKL
ncbi:hypothetical protein [Sphingobacterium olei]|nr:hypothetical protein [Sphingobacterium olei]